MPLLTIATGTRQKRQQKVNELLNRRISHDGIMEYEGVFRGEIAQTAYDTGQEEMGSRPLGELETIRNRRAASE